VIIFCWSGRELSKQLSKLMMMNRFVERVINGPHMRCRSAEQVGL